MNENISTSSMAKFNLIIIIFAIWALIQLLIVMIFSEAYFLLGTLILLSVLFIFIKEIIGTVKMNQCHVLLNEFSKKNRSVFEGLYWKLPWETIEYIVDLEITIDSDISESFTTTDGSVLVTVSIMSKPDSGFGEDITEEERSIKMWTYVKFKKEKEDNTIKTMQEARAKEIMREIFKEKTCIEAKALNHNEILKKSDFSELETEVSIKIIECPVKDIDYNKEVQESRNNLAKAQTLGEMTKILMKTGKYTKAEAKVIAPLLNKDTNLTKKINDLNINGLSMSPKLIKALEKLISKFGGE